MNKKRDYDNNWESISNAPSEIFESIDYEEFHDWRVCSWELPSTVTCIIRAEHKDTGKVNEFIYRQDRSAKRKLIQLAKTGEYEITIADHNSISRVNAHLI